jgi:hypothetical protein
MRKPLDILYNFHWIVPGDAARASQAHFGHLAHFLKRHGIATLINLRGRNPQFGWWNSETRICEQIGVLHLDAMLDSRKLPTRAMLAALFDAFDRARRPFLIKCSGGQDRTSFAAALYLIHRNGWAGRAGALAQFSRWPYLHFPNPEQRWLRLFPAYAEEQAAGRALAVWAREIYDPRAFAAWLDEAGLSHRGVFERPQASRWQW